MGRLPGEMKSSTDADYINDTSDLRHQLRKFSSHDRSRSVDMSTRHLAHDHSTLVATPQSVAQTRVVSGAYMLVIKSPEVDVT